MDPSPPPSPARSADDRRPPPALRIGPFVTGFHPNLSVMSSAACGEAAASPAAPHIDPCATATAPPDIGFMRRIFTDLEIEPFRGGRGESSGIETGWAPEPSRPPVIGSGDFDLRFGRFALEKGGIVWGEDPRIFGAGDGGSATAPVAGGARSLWVAGRMGLCWHLITPRSRRGGIWRRSTGDSPACPENPGLAPADHRISALPPPSPSRCRSPPVSVPINPLPTGTIRPSISGRVGMEATFFSATDALWAAGLGLGGRAPLVSRFVAARPPSSPWTPPPRPSPRYTFADAVGLYRFVEGVGFSLPFPQRDTSVAMCPFSWRALAKVIALVTLTVGDSGWLAGTDPSGGDPPHLEPSRVAHLSPVPPSSSAAAAFQRGEEGRGEEEGRREERREKKKREKKKKRREGEEKKERKKEKEGIVAYVSSIFYPLCRGFGREGGKRFCLW